MAAEFRTARKTLGTTPSHRGRLSNITNIINGNGWTNENELVKSVQCYSKPDLQLQQDIKTLEQINAEKDMIIAEKDQEIETQKLFMQKMQRDFYTNICKRSQQNEEIITFNTRLSKELSYVREQLKLLHHEYSQMVLVYKINESELQTRLAEIQEQLKRVSEEKEKGSNDLVNTNDIPTTATRRTRNSSARRHSMTLNGVGLEPDIWNSSTSAYPASCLDTTSVTTRGGGRPKGSGLSQKDNSSKSKVRLQECAVTTITGKRYNNRYGHLNNLEPMQEVEESEPQLSAGSTSCISQGNPSFGASRSEVTESETAVSEWSSTEHRVGDVASRSECNGAGVTKSTGPRLAIRVHKNPYDKNPPPARPNSPQRRASSQPSTPRKRSEAYISLQKKAASQPCTPGSTSPVRHTDSLLASRPSLSRTQASSPCRALKEADQIQTQLPSRMSIGGRPSRRASEVVVSYKEPNLVSKMRRPH
ncbi:hypothetical protein M758_12G036700 [Ceratodon purpureus]|nr:hypothetical protein M758_12G036700 [Ceratodon purpureus]